MILYGASGHAKVVIDILNDNNTEVFFVFDDNEEIKEFKGYQVINSYISEKETDSELIISIGDNYVRKSISNKIQHKFGLVKSRFAVISKKSDIGRGTVVFQGAVIQSDTVIGEHVIINTNSSVDHDCIIGDYSHISPGASLAGGVTVGEGTHVGIGASVIQNVKIGKWCVIGAGSVIINDIPDYSVVVGNPGKIIKTLKHER